MIRIVKFDNDLLKIKNKVSLIFTDGGVNKITHIYDALLCR